jgi:hypothetical protein
VADDVFQDKGRKWICVLKGRWILGVDLHLNGAGARAVALRAFAKVWGEYFCYYLGWKSRDKSEIDLFCTSEFVLILF